MSRLIAVLAHCLVKFAEWRNVVLTIEQVPLEPLKMGNYETKIHVRRKIKR